MPEHPGSDGPGDRYMYTYSIRLSVPEACMLGGVYYSSCQLHSRHWIIRWKDRVVSDVRGEGVIGEVFWEQKRKLNSVFSNAQLFFKK